MSTEICKKTKNFFPASQPWGLGLDRQREPPLGWCPGCGQEQYGYDRWEAGLCACCRRRAKRKKEEIMTLQEMSMDYAAQAQVIRERVRTLRSEAKGLDPSDRVFLDRRIRILTGLSRESRELAEHLAHYYERGYSRNGKYTL